MRARRRRSPVAANFAAVSWWRHVFTDYLFATLAGIVYTLFAGFVPAELIEMLDEWGRRGGTDAAVSTPGRDRPGLRSRRRRRRSGRQREGGGR
jgi:hypothetical protein